MEIYKQRCFFDNLKESFKEMSPLQRRKLLQVLIKHDLYQKYLLNLIFQYDGVVHDITEDFSISDIIDNSLIWLETEEEDEWKKLYDTYRDNFVELNKIKSPSKRRLLQNMRR